MTARSMRRLERTGFSLPRWHRRLERRLGIVFGYYRVSRPLRRGPFGLVFVGPMGPNVHPHIGYWSAWRKVRGFEVTVLGHSVYIEKVDS